MPLDAIRKFIRWEVSPGAVLAGAAAAALVVANSPLAPHYRHFLDIPVAFQAGAFVLSKPILIWINDLLMALFFMLVGLEIKRECADGALSSLRAAALPTIAAAGGMAVPAAIYVLSAGDDPVAIRGWAIPTATDIVFALGVLALAGSRVPVALAVMLTAIAIIDDLGAIAIIAAFYTENLSSTALGFAAAAVAALAVLNLAGVAHRTPYLIVGAALWLAVLKSGVHATLAGVVLALFVPLADGRGGSPLRKMEDSLHPWVGYAIVPLFGFANAGVSFAGVRLDTLLQPVPLGIALGLFLGKQVGVFGAIRLATALGIAARPPGVSWRQIYGMAVLCGIGFTMSLFIGTLAFADSAYAVPVRLGVLAGSVASAILGLLLVRGALPSAGLSLSAPRARAGDGGTRS